MVYCFQQTISFYTKYSNNPDNLLEHIITPIRKIFQITFLIIITIQDDNLILIIRNHTPKVVINIMLYHSLSTIC